MRTHLHAVTAIAALTLVAACSQGADDPTTTTHRGALTEAENTVRWTMTIAEDDYLSPQLHGDEAQELIVSVPITVSWDRDVRITERPDTKARPQLGAASSQWNGGVYVKTAHIQLAAIPGIEVRPSDGAASGRGSGGGNATTPALRLPERPGVTSRAPTATAASQWSDGGDDEDVEAPQVIETGPPSPPPVHVRITLLDTATGLELASSDVTVSADEPTEAYLDAALDADYAGTLEVSVEWLDARGDGQILVSGDIEVALN